MDLRQNRREFLGTMATFAALLPSCALLLKQSHYSYQVVQKLEYDDVREIFLQLIQTLLPLEDTAFPFKQAEEVETLMDELFAIQDRNNFVSLYRGLNWLNETKLFATKIIRVEDEPALTHTSNPEEKLATFQKLEEASYANKSSIFASRLMTTLSLDEKRVYLALWANSQFTLKRKIYTSMKILAMFAAYSSPKTWAAIGYDGPLGEKLAIGS